MNALVGMPERLRFDARICDDHGLHMVAASLNADAAELEKTEDSMGYVELFAVAAAFFVVGVLVGRANPKKVEQGVAKGKEVIKDLKDSINQ